MFGLDQKIANLTPGATLVVVIVVAILLGLRHATDPDHLTAVFTLIMTDAGDRVRSAGAVGLAWGLGHATTLFVLGLPLVLFGASLPDAVQEGAEVLIGMVIAGLAIRLLVRWRRLQIHEHRHEHERRAPKFEAAAQQHASAARQHSPQPEVHTHIHVHERGRRPWWRAVIRRKKEDHRHAGTSIRSPAQAFSVGLVHGIGGSAGVGLLLLSSIHNQMVAIVALLLFAAFTAVSMAGLSVAMGYTLAHRSSGALMHNATPVLGVVSLAFGVWYMLGAMAVVPYPF